MELEHSFGSNALCPPSGGRAVGIRESDMDNEVERLLTEGQSVRGGLDKVIAEYQKYKACFALGGGIICSRDGMAEAVDSLVADLRVVGPDVVANLVEPLPDQELPKRSQLLRGRRP